MNFEQIEFNGITNDKFDQMTVGFVDGELSFYRDKNSLRYCKRNVLKASESLY